MPVVLNRFIILISIFYLEASYFIYYNIHDENKKSTSAIQPCHAIDDHVALGVCGGNVAEADDGLAVFRRKPFVMADGHDAAVAQAGFPRAREIHADITTCSF